MPIIANINKAATAPSRFMVIASDVSTYVNYLDFMDIYASDGGNDFFRSNMKDIDYIANKFINSGSSIDQLMLDIQNNGNLYRWMCAVLCTLIYSYNDKNKLEVVNLPFHHIDPAGNVISDPQYSYLEIWKKKFDCEILNDNDVNNPPKNNENHGLNILAFGEGYHNVIGCYSKKYFVIPMKEMNLNKTGLPEWKKKYFSLCDQSDKLTEMNNLFNIRQKVLLKLSANSIENNTPPMMLIKAIIDKYITIDGANLDDASVPFYGELNSVKLYKTDDTTDLDTLLSEKISIIYDNGRYYSLYPFTQNIIRNINNNSCSIKKLCFKVELNPSDVNDIEFVQISFDYNSDLKFVAKPASIMAVPGALKYTYPVTKKYKKEDIIAVIGMHTFCMYPNIPAASEEKCKKYTYYSCDESMIMGRSIQNIASVNLQNGFFMGTVDGSENKKIILDRNKCIPRKTVIDGGERTIYSFDVRVPEHFIEVCDQTGKCYGYVLNMKLRSDSDDVPALMKQNDTIEALLIGEQTQNGSPFCAYVDFGSSSSCMKFRVGQGNHMQSIVNNSCTMRMLLVNYVKDDYKFLINDPDENKYMKFPSMSSVYNPVVGVNNYYIYHDSWMPIEKSIGSYIRSGVSVFPSNKTAVITPLGAGEMSPNIIINNMCYIIACNAVILGCSNVHIVPSIPSDDYKENMKTLWDNAIANIKDIFPDLTIVNYLSPANICSLYESIAISNGVNGVGPNTLCVNIDIGDGTTDMSAMIIDEQNNKFMCGYSSFEYAGKNLIKKTITDIMRHMSREKVELLFKGGTGYSNGLYISSDKNDYNGKVDNLINNFYNGNVLRDKPDSSWENSVIDVLNVSRMQNNIDKKVSTNFIIRYMLLMPVVKDFVETSIKIAGDKFTEITSIHISFYGGSSKGIDLLNVIDSRSNNSRLNIDKYFATAFYPHNTSVKVPVVDGKDTLIDGLSTLDIDLSDPPTITTKAGVGAIDWDRINPGAVEKFGNVDNVHSGFGKFDFVSLEKVENNPREALKYNLAKIKGVASYYDNVCNPFEELKKFFNEEIINKLVDNRDGNQDVIEIIIKDFMNNASPAMQQAANNELLGGIANSSFFRATNSKIYPEMIKDTIYMFTISELLSKFHGEFRPDHMISNFHDVDGYEFGG